MPKTYADVVDGMLNGTAEVAKIRPKSTALRWRLTALEAAAYMLQQHDNDLGRVIQLRDQTSIGQVRTTLDEVIARCKKVTPRG